MVHRKKAERLIKASSHALNKAKEAVKEESEKLSSIKAEGVKLKYQLDEVNHLAERMQIAFGAVQLDGGED